MKLTIGELRETVKRELAEHFGGEKLPRVDPAARRKIDSFAFDISVGSDELQPYGYTGNGRLPAELVTRLGEILGVAVASKEELKYFVSALDRELAGMENP